MDAIVYKTTPGKPQEEVMTVLGRHGLSPYVVDSGDPSVHYVTRGNLFVQIAVPPQQRSAALKVLAEWEAENESRVGSSSRQFLLQAAVSLLLALLASVVIGRLKGFEDIAGIFVFTWIASFFVTSFIWKIWNKDGDGRSTDTRTRKR